MFERNCYFYLINDRVNPVLLNYLSSKISLPTLKPAELVYLKVSYTRNSLIYL